MYTTPHDAANNSAQHCAYFNQFLCERKLWITSNFSFCCSALPAVVLVVVRTCHYLYSRLSVMVIVVLVSRISSVALVTD